MFGSEIHTVGHSAFLAFDKAKEQVYFIDPNGRTDFFNNSLALYNEKNGCADFTALGIDVSIDTESLFESILRVYINDLNETFSMSYKFVSRKIMESSRMWY